MATGNSRIICGTEKEWGDGGAIKQSDGSVTKPKAVVLRRTNFKVEPSRPELTSGEMRSDPFRAPSRLGATEIKGEFGFEPIPGDHDTMFAAILHSDWAGNTLEAGKDFTPRSLFLEHQTLGQHILYKGVVMEKLSLTFSPDELVKATGNFLAKNREELDESSVEETSIAPASMDIAPVSWDGIFKVDGVASSIMTSLTLDIARTINLRNVLGSKEPTAAVASKFELTGSMTMRPADTKLWQKFHNESHISLEVTIYGVPNTKSYTFSLPKLLLTNAPEDLSDPEDLLIEIPFVAEVDPVSGVPLIITRG
jgi:hypothetical protein